MIVAQDVVLVECFPSSQEKNPVHDSTNYVEVGQNFHLVFEALVWVF